MFYCFYFLNALAYVCGRPLHSPVLLMQSFDRWHGNAMGLAYLGIGIGGATVRWISNSLVYHFGWQAELRILGLSLAVFSFGGDYAVISLMAAENFGIEILGRLLGVITISGRLARAAAPWAVGRLRDVTGTYTAARFALIGVAVLGGLAVLSLPDRRRVE